MQGTKAKVDISGKLNGYKIDFFVQFRNHYALSEYLRKVVLDVITNYQIYSDLIDDEQRKQAAEKLEGVIAVRCTNENIPFTSIRVSISGIFFED